MAGTRKRYSAEFKAKVALEAIRGAHTLSELGARFKVHPIQVAQWKRTAVEQMAEVFQKGRPRAGDGEIEREALFEQIGRLKMELDWTKKKLDCWKADAKRELVEEGHRWLSLRSQCELLGLSRSSWYYQPAAASEEDLVLMRLLDEIYTERPYFGSRRMVLALRERGWGVNRKRVARLMGALGLEAIYPGPDLSRTAPENMVYPYLLRGMTVERVGQVWSSDITYIRMRRGHVYLVAVIDWYSRYVVSWRLSVTLDSGFCCEALEEALEARQPEIFNTDQGSQFTSSSFTQRLLDRKVAISMDGRGRALDNVFTERLWRSVKYEEVYLRDYNEPAEARAGLARYFDFYNHRRWHQGLGYQFPAAVFTGRAPGLALEL